MALILPPLCFLYQYAIFLHKDHTFSFRPSVVCLTVPYSGGDGVEIEGVRGEQQSCPTFSFRPSVVCLTVPYSGGDGVEIECVRGEQQSFAVITVVSPLRFMT